MPQRALRKTLRDFANDRNAKVRQLSNSLLRERGSPDDGNARELALQQAERQLESDVTDFAQTHGENLAVNSDLVLEYINNESHRRVMQAVIAAVPKFSRLVRIVFAEAPSQCRPMLQSHFKRYEGFCVTRRRTSLLWHAASCESRVLLLLSLLRREGRVLLKRLARTLGSRFLRELRLPLEWHHLGLWIDMQLSLAGSAQKASWTAVALAFLQRVQEFDGVFLQQRSDALQQSRAAFAVSLLPQLCGQLACRCENAASSHSAECRKTESLALLRRLFGLRTDAEGVTTFETSPGRAFVPTFWLAVGTLESADSASRATGVTGEVCHFQMQLLQALLLWLREHKNDTGKSAFRECNAIFALVECLFDEDEDSKPFGHDQLPVLRHLKSTWFVFDDSDSVLMCTARGRELCFNMRQVWPLVWHLSQRTDSYGFVTRLFAGLLDALCSTRSEEGLLSWCRECNAALAFSGIEVLPPPVLLMTTSIPQFPCLSRGCQLIDPGRFADKRKRLVLASTLISFLSQHGDRAAAVFDAIERADSDASRRAANERWQQELEAHRRQLFAPASLLLKPYLCEDLRSVVRDYVLDPTLPRQLSLLRAPESADHA